MSGHLEGAVRSRRPWWLWFTSPALMLENARLRLENHWWRWRLKRENPDAAHMVDWDEHPEGHDGPCLCGLCRSYGDLE